LFKRFEKGRISVDDEKLSWRTSTRTTTENVAMFNIEGIIYKEFVPQGQAVNVKLYCKFWGDWGPVIRRKLPENCSKILGTQFHDNAPSRVSLVLQQVLASTSTKVIHTFPPQRTTTSVIFSYYQRWNLSLRNIVPILRVEIIYVEGSQ
jgi:hypothetical protein